MALLNNEIHPGLIILTLAAGLLPVLFWLWFWLKEDALRPEPKRLIIRIFILGAAAVAAAYVLESTLVDIPKVLAGNDLFWPVMALSAIEEVLKLGVVCLATLGSPYFDEPVDAMIYMITAALGFAAVENTLFMLSSLSGNGGTGWGFLLTGNFRFLGATIVHVVASSVVGGMIGLAFYYGKFARLVYAILGLEVAILLHALFNYFIIKSAGGQVFQIFILLWFAALLIILFFEKVKNNTLEFKTNKFTPS
jgi:RsiW-degrading membrane proteinase PrsW (M82 family)